MALGIVLVRAELRVVVEVPPRELAGRDAAGDRVEEPEEPLRRACRSKSCGTTSQRRELNTVNPRPRRSRPAGSKWISPQVAAGSRTAPLRRAAAALRCSRDRRARRALGAESPAAGNVGFRSSLRPCLQLGRPGRQPGQRRPRDGRGAAILVAPTARAARVPSPSTIGSRFEYTSARCRCPLPRTRSYATQIGKRRIDRFTQVSR